MSNPWGTQIASDVIRDGLGLELLDPANNVVAEVFRCDADHTVTVSTFESLPLHAVEWLIGVARAELGAFENGSPLPLPAAPLGNRTGGGP